MNAILAALASLITGTALSSVGSAIKANALPLAAIGLDLVAVGSAYLRDGKGEAITVVAAILASMAFLPRITFGVQPAPISESTAK